MLRIVVRQAGPGDAAAIVAILRGAEAWLRSRGTPMWRDEELDEARIAADVDAGLMFVGENDGEPVGTVKFQLSNPRFWPDVPEGDAVYIHRLAVRRDFARGLVAPALLAWTAERGRGLGRRVLRLDCEFSRSRLRAVYERSGFTFHSQRTVGPYVVARYEMDLRGASR